MSIASPVVDKDIPSQQSCIVANNTTYVRIWLQSICMLIFIMVIVGGATRLTDSGLSITEWKPILGAIPPLNSADWQEAFVKYKQIPEYKIVNHGMSLDEFKVIYWWEWAHRFLGRFIGVAFFLPFLFFVFTKCLSPVLTYKLLFIFALGGLQGFMGWYMVQSGLTERVDVSQYRLAAHLGLAVIIFGLVYWLSCSLQPRGQTPARRAPNWMRYSAYGLIAVVFLQIILGAFVAGLHAGRSHNTWPLMDGQPIPDGLFIMAPWYLNFFENVLTVQFDHRILAYIICIWVLFHLYGVVKYTQSGLLQKSAVLMVLAVFAQTVLGIWTLLAHVPIDLGLLHQGGALVVFTLILRHAHCVRGVH
ncbi:MAG: COX15/CtaA family protein [Pseudomonadota bacterium]